MVTSVSPARVAPGERWRLCNVHDPTRVPVFTPPARREAERSPFARLAELLAGHRAGQTPDQSVIRRAAASGSRLRRPGAGEIHRPSSGAIRSPRASSRSARPPPTGSAAASSCRAPLDPESEVLVLNGSREGLFFAAIAAERYVGAATRQAGDPGAEPVLSGLRRRAPVGRLRDRVPAGDRPENDFLPDLDALSDDAARAHGRLLHRLAREPARLGRKPRLFRQAEVRWRDRHGFMVFTDECYSEIYTDRSRPAAARSRRTRLRERRRVPVAVEALEPARHARRLRRRRQEIPHRLPRAAQRRRTAGAGAAAAGRGRLLQRRSACGGEPHGSTG